MAKAIQISSFKFDNGLGYLIQQVTKESSEDILGYFAGMAQFVVDDLSAKSKASWISKDIILFYKETPITFRMTIQGTGPGRYYEGERGPSVSVCIGYPKSLEGQDIKGLLEAITEVGLGLRDPGTTPAFEKPELKTPASLRKMKLAQNEQRTKKPEQPT